MVVFGGIFYLKYNKGHTLQACVELREIYLKKNPQVKPKKTSTLVLRSNIKIFSKVRIPLLNISNLFDCFFFFFEYTSRFTTQVYSLRLINRYIG